MCQRYGQRPSQTLSITDPEIALDFDLAMATVHRYEEDSALQQSGGIKGLLKRLF